MQQIASSFEKLRLTEVVKNVKLAQSIDKGKDGNFSRLYKLTLEFEDAKKLSEKLGISYTYLCKIFADRFVPRLMELTLKDLRKSAEADMGGVQASGVGTQNVNDLKNTISETRKVTVQARGEGKAKPEDEDQEIEHASGDDAKAGQSDEEEDRDSMMNEMADTDGNVKKAAKKIQ